MLVAIFAAVGLGVIARSFGRRMSRLSLALALVLTATYFLRPNYMT
jgi:hypothetical protein